MKSTACLFLLLSLVACCLASCPTNCKCPAPGFVDCSKAGLVSLPASMPSTTINLDLSFNQIRSIPSKAFAGAPSLRFLNFNNNLLSSISPDAFTDLPDLQNLSLANNALPDAFDVSSISSTNSLLDLNLANNLLTQIPALKSTSLKRLTLSGNAIRSAAFPASFSSCFNLQSVVLSGNQIAAIGAKDFASLTPINIVSLDFNANRITSIDPKALTAVGLSLNNLGLNRNRLTAAALADALKGYEDVPSIVLMSLSVSSNAIAKFDESVLAPLAYTLFNSLQLDGHRMLDLDPKAFQSVRKSLKTLSLRGCRLSALPDAVSSLSSLQTLRLDGNSFLTLPPNLPPTLRSLSMTQNGLQGWTGDALSRLTNLQQLDLSKNSLETVTDTGRNPLHSCTGRLKLLGLAGNPFDCSCELSWFVTWGGSEAGSAVQAFDSLKCASPENMTGELLKDVNMSECGSHDESSDSHHEKTKHSHHQKRKNKDSKEKRSKKRQHHKKSHHQHHHHNGEL